MTRAIISIILYFSAICMFIIIGPAFVILSFILPINLMYKLSRAVSWLMLLSMGVCVKRDGAFPDNNNYIYMFNHSSFIDVFLFGFSMKGPCAAIIATENYQYPIWGTMLRRYRAIPINRKDKQSSYESINIAEKILKDGYDVIILPEGTRTITGNLNRFKKGGFHMAINTNTPIVPVGVVGAYKFKPKNRWWMRPGPVAVNIGDPITPDFYAELGVDGLSTKVGDLLKNLSGETYETK